MRITSRFAPKCPTCLRALPPATFHAGHDQPWACLACAAPVCCWCYAEHTGSCCPDLGVVVEHDFRGGVRGKYAASSTAGGKTP